MREGDATTAAARASALLTLGRADEAERVAREALQLDPNDASLLVLLSRVLLDRRDHRGAHETAARAVEADPGNVIALSCLAAALAGLGKRRDALQAVDRAVDLAPELAGLHRQRAEILLGQGDSRAALGAARQARQLAPESAEIAASLAEILAANNEFADADSEAARALRLNPESARAHRAAGYVQLRQGGGSQSIGRFREALRLDPTSRPGRQGLAAALKSRNPVYRGLLRFGSWLDSLGTGARWAVRLAPLVVVRLLSGSVPQNPVATGITIAIGLALLVTWATDPVSNLTLMTSRTGRALLSTRQRGATLAFAGFTLFTIGSFVGSIETKWLVPYGFGFALWALVVGTIYTVTRPVAFRVLVAVSVIAAVAGVVGVVFVGIGLHGASIACSAVLFVSAIPAAWAIALAR